ncbi:MAG: cysteine-rich CWC family protein [Bacteroidetes bacterium]|nr:cysteine-rich CWC family protein [Bacteroidota bacterium]
MMFPLANSTQKSCSKCSKAFDCNIQGGCWCNGYKISAETLKKLLLKYDNCLCEACLKEFASEEVNI